MTTRQRLQLLHLIYYYSARRGLAVASASVGASDRFNGSRYRRVGVAVSLVSNGIERKWRMDRLKPRR